MQVDMTLNMKRAGLGVAMAVLLAGCAPTPEEVVTDVEGNAVNTSGLQERLPDTCNLTNYDGYVGQPVAAVAIPPGVKTRIVRPADILSQVYEAARVNFYVDEAGTITRVICG